MKMVNVGRPFDVIDFKPPSDSWKCSFMFDNHAFAKCEGTLAQIEQQLFALFQQDKFGMWGHLSHKTLPNYEVCGPDGKHAFVSHFEKGIWPDDGYRIMFDVLDDFEGVPI